MNLAELVVCAVALDKVSLAFDETREMVRELRADGFTWFHVGEPCHCTLCLLRAEHVALHNTWSQAFRESHARRIVVES